MLVAVNPFKKVPLYGYDYIEAYRRKSMDSPHVYAIADTAIREMIRGVSSSCYDFFVIILIIMLTDTLTFLMASLR